MLPLEDELERGVYVDATAADGIIETAVATKTTATARLKKFFAEIILFCIPT